jgi:hypothetical protein
VTRDDLPRLEFWPEHDAGPLWDADGRPATGDHLGLPPELVGRLEAFTAAYAEERLPIDGAGDQDYLAFGAHLLADVRAALAGRFVVVVTEPWWAPVSPPPAAGPPPRP